MKTITVEATGVDREKIIYRTIGEGNGLIVQMIIPDTLDASDGYHTFNELYEHRSRLFISLCKVLSKDAAHNGVWRSKSHSDGSIFDGWFIMGIGKEKGNQITYHLPLSVWEATNFADILDKAPDWDGHTSNDVLERIKRL